MKVSFPLASLALLSGFQVVSAHYIWTTLVAGDTVSKTAVRQPPSNSPVLDVTSDDIRCNVSPANATATVSVAAGDIVGFQLDNTIYHLGPAALYLGKAPSTAADWDGSGANWFKIAEWGAVFEPSFSFIDYGASALNATIPSSVPAGEYLARIEQIGLHVTGAPQWYISCAQISITDGGSASPDMVEIPGYVDADDPGLTVNIYYPTPTAYTVPGPTVFSE
ncbi:glycoside hydrolase family 61 protein [Guyanagaster necrorhizus]|uniref:AA9 family lytic polysaccharide monooxygenase n=1 Tax=Guyanagaster necrorhizus TaxID=856835 RepID=A0A9P7VNG3_9AGAR|nr:glycoside hydrolase family 61 protein [Guyanagaster necrorhizus MCA 3950]KAG7443768.1 glycoside hydrolase family 61 protein [Guyanagaster necrorhizus MCA 3950]